MFKRVLFTDDALVLSIKKGDKNALVYLYDSNYRSIRKLITSNNGNDEDADDILQEAVIAVWQNVNKPTFTLTSKLSTYIYSIAHNLWLKQLRTKQKFISLQVNHERIMPSDRKENNESQVEIIAQCMKALSDTCRELLSLFYFEELDFQQIASRLQFANADTAKAKKYQCKKKLEEIVKAKYSKSDFLY